MLHQRLLPFSMLLLMIFSSIPALGQQLVFKKELEMMLETAKGLLIPTLNADELKIFQQTDIRIVNQNSIIASPFATIENGRRVIQFSTGYYRVLYAMGDLTLIQYSGQYGDDVMIRWFNYALPKLFANERIPSGQRQFIKWPSDYLGVPLEDLVKWHEDNDTGRLFTSLVLNSLMMVLAHETAHQVLGHTQRRPRDLAESRARERSADEWAVKHLLEAEVMPIAGIYALMLYYFLDQDAINHEEMRTHPSEIRRIKELVQTTLDNLPRFRDRLGLSDVPDEQFKLNLKRALEKIEDEIAAVSLR